MRCGLLERENDACVVDCSSFLKDDGDGTECKSLPEERYAIDFGCPENPGSEKCHIGRIVDIRAQFSATAQLPGVTAPFTWSWPTDPGLFVELEPDGWMHGMHFVVADCYWNRLRVQAANGSFREKALQLCVGW